MVLMMIVIIKWTSSITHIFLRTFLFLLIIQTKSKRCRRFVLFAGSCLHKLWSGNAVRWDS